MHIFNLHPAQLQYRGLQFVKLMHVRTIQIQSQMFVHAHFWWTGVQSPVPSHTARLYFQISQWRHYAASEATIVQVEELTSETIDHTWSMVKLRNT